MIRLLPKPHGTFRRFATLCEDRGWIHIASHEGTEDAPAEEIWNTESEDTTVRWVVDAVILLDYITVIGDADREVSALVRAAFPCFDSRDLIGGLIDAEKWHQRVQALYRVAAGGSPAYETSIAKQIQISASAGDPRERRAAYLTAAYLGWERLGPVLLDISEKDTDQEVREFARDVLR